MLNYFLIGRDPEPDPTSGKFCCVCVSKSKLCYAAAVVGDFRWFLLHIGLGPELWT